MKNKTRKSTCIYNLFFGITTFCTIISSTNIVSAEIVPDNTLPNNSKVKVEENKSIIEGGTTAGSNLFHSFEKFGIDTENQAHFNNAVDISNIITRVTGKSISDIDGLIKANGSANLFLINPNGIVFGDNARLDIGGSFVGSTADSLIFPGDVEFSAVNPDVKPLLTMNVPVGLQYGNNLGSIQVKGDGEGIRNSSEIVDTQNGLRVKPDKTLALIGGDINLESATLKTGGGRIELGSFVAAGLVNMTSVKKGFSFDYDNLNGGNIELSQQTTVDASGNGAGDIRVWGRDIKLTNGSVIETSTLGSENGGSLIVNGQESVEVIGNSNSQFTGLFASVYPQATGNGGNLVVETNNLLVKDGAEVSSNTFGEGKSGNLTITTNSLLAKDGAQVSASTFGKGKGGNLNIDAVDIQLIGTSKDNRFVSGLFASAQPNSTGDAGNLTITTNSLLVKDGAQVLASNFEEGKGGNLTIDAVDIQLIGTTKDGQIISGLLASSEANSTGDAGNLTITTNSLLAKDGAQVSASTFGKGKGGNLNIDAVDIQLIGTSQDNQFVSGLFASAQPTSTGNAGNLKVDTGILQIKNGATVSVTSLGTGKTGNLILNTHSIRLNNNALIFADTRNNNNSDTKQATININSQDLIMRRGSNIITNARGENVIGGNININTDFLIANENSDISANSENFRGGNVRIDAKGIFGTQFRPQLTPQSDITATGATSDLSGNVEIITPQTDPTSGSIRFPTIPVETKVADACSTPGYAQSSFTITGKGSLPPSPFEPLTGRLNQTKLATLSGEIKPQSNRKRQNNQQEPEIKEIVEAQGLVRTPEGKIILVAYNPQNTVSSHIASKSCKHLHELRNPRNKGVQMLKKVKG